MADDRDIITHIDRAGWAVASVIGKVPDAAFTRDVKAAVAAYELGLAAHAKADSPYGVPYKPDIWGAGWIIQEFGVKQWMLHKGWPELVPVANFVNALNFDLGVHPGENNASFVSGVGAHSATVAYGFNRADWTYIPGGVISGTALIRPDLPIVTCSRFKLMRGKIDAPMLMASGIALPSTAARRR